jgi:hypothetical protein
MEEVNTMISIIQVIAVVFGLFAWSRAWLRWKGREITIGEFFFWSFCWLALILVAFFPQKSPYFANILGIQRGVDIFVYLGVTLLFYLVFRMYVRMEKMEQALTKIVRELAKK